MILIEDDEEIVTLFEEYVRQQTWRNWTQFIKYLPINEIDVVLDLGCSVGGFTRIISERCATAIGIDISTEFIAYCNDRRRDNEWFVQERMENLDDRYFSQANGVWCAYAISYLAQPEQFIKRIFKVLPSNSWVGIVDVDHFVSGNLPEGSPIHQRVVQFESDSWKSGLYDFCAGGKIKSMLLGAGFKILHQDEDVDDLELNFDGVASFEIVLNWKARLERLKGLQQYMGKDYIQMTEQLLGFLTSTIHKKNRNVKFIVARKA